MTSVGAIRHIGAVMLAALCWGTIGVSYALFERWFAADELSIVTLRALSASLLLAGWWWVREREVLIMPRHALGPIAVLGLISVTLFYLTLVYAFAYTSVSVGTLLLYLAPAFVTVGAALFLNEPLTPMRVAALIASLAGCALIVEAYRPANLQANALGIALGLGAAITYGSYSLMAKPLMRRVRGETIVVGHLIFGAGALLLAKLIIAPGTWPSPGAIVVICAYSALVLTIVPVTFYTYGLRGLPTGEASIIATLEPVVAMTLATLILNERLGGSQLVGAACVLGSVVLLAAGRKRPRRAARAAVVRAL